MKSSSMISSPSLTRPAIPAHFLPGGLLVEALKNFLKARDVARFICSEVLLETGAKLVRTGGLGEFRQSLHQFVFGVVQIP